MSKKTEHHYEIEILKTKIENKLLRAGLVYPDEFNELTMDISDGDKKTLIELLKTQYAISVDKDMVITYRPQAAKSPYDTSSILRDILKLDYVNTTPNYVQVGQTFYKGIICTKFPSSTKADWLGKIVSEKAKIDYTLIMSQSEMAELRLLLRKKLRDVENELYQFEKTGRSSPELERRKEDITTMLDGLGKEFVEFKVSMYLVVKGSTLDEVESLKEYTLSTLRSMDIYGIEANYMHEYVLKTIIPTGPNPLKKYELLVPNDALKESFPFMHPWQSIEPEDEVVLGFNESALMVTGNIWKLNSYSGAYIGQTGSGKSLAAKYEIFQQMMVSGAKVIVIDPAAARLKDTPGEYYRMCNLLKGKYVSFSTDSKNLPNVMGTLPNTIFEEEMRRIDSIIRIFFEDEERHVSEAQKPLISSAIVEAFRRKGITKRTKIFWKKKQPKIEDLIFVLRRGLASAKTEATRMSYEAMIKRLEPCVGEGLRSYLNTSGTEEDVHNQFTVFEFKDTPDDDKPLLITRMLSYIKKVAMETLDRTIIVLEEAQFWLRDPNLSKYLAEAETTIRKTNTGIRLIFQDLGQLEGCKEALTLLGNLEFVYVFRMAPNLISITKNAFKLNDAEARVIELSRAGDYGILIWENKHYKLKIVVDPETYKVITTNPDDLKRIEAEEGVRKEESDAKQLMIRDLGYEPITLEGGLLDIVSKIKRNQISSRIVDHYPKKYRQIIINLLKKNGKEERKENPKTERKPAKRPAAHKKSPKAAYKGKKKRAR